MKKKQFIKTIVMSIITTVLLFVVSFAWFEGDYRDKNINSNEVSISTSKDLILTYKNSVYSSLNLSDIISKEFEFGQVTSTGLSNAKFYKVDYTKELDNLPAEYTEAVANEDYLEFNIKITASDSPKRVFLDGVNSGFQNVTTDFGDYNGIKPADCMRCSISFADSSTSTTRTIILANKTITEYVEESNVTLYNECVQEQDLIKYAKDSSKNDIKTQPLYASGQAQYHKAIMATDDYPEYAKISGVQIPTFFTEYDFTGVSEDNLNDARAILFDLRAYQEKNVTIRIWLEGQSIPENDNSLTYISGQYITFVLKFASLNNQDVDYNVRYIKGGNNVNTINNYLSREGLNRFSKVLFDPSSKNYKLKSYEAGTYKTDLTITEGGVTYTYKKDTESGYYYCTDSNFDKLYYNMERQAAYVPYSALTWKLRNATKERDYGTNIENVVIASIEGDNKIKIPSIKETKGNIIYDAPILGESFTLIGYYNGISEKTVVVNELYMATDVYNKVSQTYIIDSTKVESDTFNKNIEDIIADLNNGDTTIYTYKDYFYYVIDGEVHSNIFSYEDLNWNITLDKYDSNNSSWSLNTTDDDITLSNEKQLIINNCSSKTGYVDENTKVYDFVFNLTGSINLEGRTYDIINILVVINCSGE